MVDVPEHVAIIPDGNRRWADMHNVSVPEGHREGAQAIRTVVNHAADRGVSYVSVWGMSMHNLQKRSSREVAALLEIFRDKFNSLAQSDDIHDRQVRIQVFGEWEDRFPFPVKRSIRKAIDATEQYSKRYLTIFLAYNGTQEMLRAVQNIVDGADGRHIAVTEDLLKSHLYTHDMPAVDYLIRTGGEPHLSAGFMMWDMADAQLYFTDTLWPAFGERELDEALEDYGRRRRKRGK